MSDPPPKRKWMVMIYLAGDDSLTDECVHALTRMKEAEGLDEICVIAQFDPKGARLKWHRYEISHVSKKPALSDDFVKWKENEKIQARALHGLHGAPARAPRPRPHGGGGDQHRLTRHAL